MVATGSVLSESLNRAHALLFEDITKLERAPQTSSELATCLDATRKHVAEHFRLEEQDGYMATVKKREPSLTRIIEQLADEHRQLTRSLDDLVRDAKSAKTLDEGLRQRVHNWADTIRQHEARENDVVQRVFNSDIGAED